jgi:uncharacterized protein YndB with AHSA1/START domain
MSAVEHTTFTIERDLPGSPRHAFRFWSEKALKRRWTDCHPDWTVLEDRFDFAPGGEEAVRWRTTEGIEQTFTARYLDIVSGHRIIYAFEMSSAGARVSASLATVEFRPGEIGTKMLYTEQMAFLAGAEAMQMRIAGTGTGFDRLIDAIAMDISGVH